MTVTVRNGRAWRFPSTAVIQHRGGTNTGNALTNVPSVIAYETGPVQPGRP